MPLLLLVLGCSAYWQLFTTFRFWDDEGYVLISLRNFAAGGHLYSEVYSQYGPVYNLLFGLLHRFGGLPLDTTSARWLSLVAWLLSVLAATVLVLRLTRSLAWALAGGLVAFFQLRLLTHEPLHPVGLLAALLMTGAAFGAIGAADGKFGRGGAVAAASGMLMAFIKINVGLFFLAGLGTCLVWSSRSPLARPWARVVLAGLATTAGAVLLRPLIQDGWVREFLVVYLFATVTTLAIIGSSLEPASTPRELLRPALLATLGTGVVVLVASLLVGIGFAALFDGVVRGPLRHPTSFSFPFRWAGLTVPVLGANALGFALYLGLRRARSAWADRLVVACRAIAAGGMFVSYFHGFAVSVEAYLLSFGAGFLWAVAAPLGNFPREIHVARQLLALLALFQLLHTFPVAGTQLNLATLLLALLLVIGAAETTAWIRAFPRPRLAIVFTSLAIALPAWGCGVITLEARHDYATRAPETFAGTGLRLSAWQTSALSVLTANARRSGDMLFSLPGMFSFNLWTGLPAPTGLNITQWWSLLEEQQQAKIATQLDRAARPIVIVQRNLITTGLAKTAYHPSLLTRFIEERFTPVFSLDSYEFWVRKGADVHPIGIARWRPATPSNAFEFFSPADDFARARRIEFRHYDRNADSPLATATEFAFTAGTLTADGVVPWQCRVTLPSSFIPAACDAARLLDATGAVLLELRFERAKHQANPE